jgi:hypothetical protein
MITRERLRGKGDIQETPLSSGQYPIRNVEKGRGKHCSIHNDPDNATLLYNEKSAASVTGVSNKGGPNKAARHWAQSDTRELPPRWRCYHSKAKDNGEKLHE